MRLDKVIATFSAESMHVELLHPRVQSTVNHWQSSPGKMHCFVLMGNYTRHLLISNLKI